MKFFDTLKKYANMVESENKRLKSMYAKLISEAMEAGVDEDDCIENECSKCDPDAVTSESDTKRKRANDKKCCDEADTTFEEGEDLMSAEEFFESDDVKECNESKKCPKCGKDPCVCEADDEKNLQSAEDFFDPAKKAVVECDKDDMIGLDTEDVEESNDACVEESEEEIAEESEDSDADDMNEKEEWMDAKEFFEDEDEEDKKTKPVEEAQRWLSAEDLLNGKLVGEKEDIDEDDISADDFFESEDD